MTLNNNIIYVIIYENILVIYEINYKYLDIFLLTFFFFINTTYKFATILKYYHFFRNRINTKTNFYFLLYS